MPQINSPSSLRSSLDYQEECKFALEPSISKLIEMAEAAGWDRSHIVIAVLRATIEMAEDNVILSRLKGNPKLVS